MNSKLSLRISPPAGLLIILAGLIAAASPLLADPEDYADYVRPADRTSLFSSDPRDVVFMGGDIAVIAAKESLEVVLNDFSGPTVVGAIPLKAVSVARVGGTCVAVGTDIGVTLVDVTDPTNPQIRETIPLSGEVVGVASFPKTGGGFHVHAVAESTYTTFDVFGCQSTTVPQSVQLPDAANGVDGTDGVAVVGTESCLVVIDPTNSPSILGTTPGQFGDVKISPVSQRRVFTTRNDTFTIIDITDTSMPTVVFESDPFPAFRIAPCDPGTLMAGQKGSFVTQQFGPLNCLDIIAVTETDWGVRTYDVSDPSNPTLIGGVQLPGAIAGLDWRGDHIGAVGADPLGFQLVHAENPASPTNLGDVPNLNTPVAAHLEKGRDLLYVIDGLPTKIYDVSNPGAPVQQSMMNTGGIDIYALDNHVYVVDGGMMQVWDVDDPANPFQVGSLNGAYLSVAADAGQSGLIAAGRFAPENAVDIIDVSDPTMPSIRASLSLPSIALSLDTKGTSGVVALGDDGIGVVDFCDPDSPDFEIFPTFAPAKSATFTDAVDRILVGNDRGIALYDSTGALLGMRDIPTLREANDVRLGVYGRENGFAFSQADSTREVAYAICVFGTMYVMDITDAQNIFVIGEYTDPGLLPLFLEASQSALYLGDGSASGQTLILPPQLLTIATTDIPEPNWRPGEFALQAPVPNPFTGSARVQFVLAEPATVSLAVYDVAGRELRQLAAGPRNAGVHTLTWDGRSASGDVMAAGVYFLRLAVGSQFAVRKIVRVP